MENGRELTRRAFTATSPPCSDPSNRGNLSRRPKPGLCRLAEPCRRPQKSSFGPYPYSTGMLLRIFHNLLNQAGKVRCGSLNESDDADNEP